MAGRRASGLRPRVPHRAQPAEGRRQGRRYRRRADPARGDKEETVRHRLSVYHSQTKPLVDFYQKLSAAEGTRNTTASPASARSSRSPRKCFRP
ncbi:nucleoside monophosphate kinase [Pseudomonas aeruginosa]